MTHIKTKLAGIAFGLGLTLSLVALPLLAGAETNEALMSQYSHHRFFFSEEEVWNTEDEAVATYAIIELTDLERIAGRTDLDQATIKFLEDNLSEDDFRENRARGAEVTHDWTILEIVAGRRNLDQETIEFLEENLWEYDGRAEYAGPIDVDSLPVEAYWFFLETYLRQHEQADDTKVGVYAIDLDMFSDEIFWQDRVEPLAGPASVADEASAVVSEPLPPGLTP